MTTSIMSNVRLVFVAICASLSLGRETACSQTNYGNNCPEGWNKFGRTKCVAPLSYEGPCLATMDVESHSESYKQQLENKCNVQWPCYDTCDQTFSMQTCPVDWLELDGGLCEAPVGYAGNCNSKIQITSDDQKHDLAKSCGVRWPCSATCEENYKASCPQGWAHLDGNICQVIPGKNTRYTGPCLPFANLDGMDEVAKRTFAALCNVQFCMDPTTTPSNGYHFDDCPDGWSKIGSKSPHCYNKDYKGPCRQVISLEDLALIGQNIFAQQCRVSWATRANKTVVFSTHTETNAMAMKETPAILESYQQNIGGNTAPSGPVAADGSIVASTWS